MSGSAKALLKRGAFPIIGAIFLLLGVIEFLKGDSWIVWFILAFLFGGFGIFGKSRKDAGEP